jgi:hypothetical protein
MISIPKVVGLMSCGFLLCLGLSNAAQAGNAASAADEMKAGQSDRKGGQAGLKSGHTIEGEVLRVEGDNYFVKGQDGKEVRLHTDQTTQQTGNISQGDRIEAMVNDQNHALSIRSAQGTDAGYRKEGGRDSLHETDADHGK